MSKEWSKTISDLKCIQAQYNDPLIKELVDLVILCIKKEFGHTIRPPNRVKLRNKIIIFEWDTDNGIVSLDFSPE